MPPIIPIKNRTVLPDGFMWSADAAHYLGITDSALRQYRNGRKGPHFFVVDNWRVAYRREDLDAYIAAQADAMRAEADALVAARHSAEPVEPTA